VVGAAATKNGQLHAFLWKAGTMTDLGMSEDSSSAALAIDDQGRVIGDVG
jgi:probable HAF family extracellular repeat protein